MDGADNIVNTGVDKPSKAQSDEQLRRILQSETFRHATTLQRLLQYLGSNAIEDPLAEIKEYTIGVDVFDRGSGYDPKIDTVARVQIHRLRLKIKEYYEKEGASDQILIELPKGHYLPIFETRPATTGNSSLAALIVDSPSVAAVGQVASRHFPALRKPNWQRKHRPTKALWLRRAAMVAIVLLVYVYGLFVGTHWDTSSISSGNYGFPMLSGMLTNAAADPPRTFWADFLGNDRAPVVGYADAVFLADQTNDLFRFNRGASNDRGTPVEPHLAKQFSSNPALIEKAGPLYYEDGYTGTGDVEGIFALTRLFTQMGLQVTVKRCRLVTIDDLREHNVILLGSSDQNDAVAELPQNADFVFQHGNPPGAWGAHFENLRPQAGESGSYKAERDPTTGQLMRNYGLITVQPGVVPGRYIAILSALDTSGVAADAQFISSSTQMAELQERLEALGAWKNKGQPPIFQALLQVDVKNGNDVLDVKLLDLHVIRPNGDSAQGSIPSRPTQSTR
jgi:hypothetical protein